MDLKRSSCRLVALSYPQDAAGGVILRQFLRIFSSLCSRVSLVTDSERYEGVERILVESPRRRGFAYHFRYQVRVARALIQYRHSWDAAAFLVGGIGMLVPLVMTRVLGKKSFLVVTGFPAEIQALKDGGPSVTSFMLSVLERISPRIANRTVSYGRMRASSSVGPKFHARTVTTGAKFVDTNLFSMGDEPSKRDPIVGFAGRLSTEKGVLEFVRAVAIARQHLPDLRVEIVGDGPLRGAMVDLIRELRIGSSIGLHPWVDQRDLPRFYHRAKLLVLPSYTEGLPNVLLEAMASGAIVLATSVGTVPNVIQNGRNGFLVDGNSPSQLAAAIVASMTTSPSELDAIARAARSDVASEYGFQSALERYRLILDAVMELSSESGSGR